MRWTSVKIMAVMPFATLLHGCVSVIADASTNTQTVTRNQTAIVADTTNLDIIFTPDEFFQKMRQKRMIFLTGWSQKTDIWVICIQEIPLTAGMTETEAADIAEVRAKKQIAAFLGSSATSQEELIYKEETVDGKTTSQEFFRSVKRVDVKQFLRGVTLFNQEVKNGHLCAAYYVTGKLVDASAAFESQLRSTSPGVVQSVGFGIIIDEKIAPAKRKALQTALRNAVEQVMGTMVVGQSQLMDNDKVKSKIISQTVGNVKQYRILKEFQTGNNYQVIINAQVDEKSILDNYTAMVRSMGNPGFYVHTADPDLHTAFSGFLSDLGFKVTTDKNDAQFVFDADCKYLEVDDSQYGKGLQIDLALQLYDKGNHQQLISIQNMPRLTSTYSGSFHQIRQSAAEKAFKTIKKQLHEKLNKVVMDWVLNGHSVKLTFIDFPANADIVKILENAIAGIPCAKVHTKSINGNTIDFSCSYVGPTADFEYFLQERLKKDLPASISSPQTTQIQLSSLVLKFNRKENVR